MRHFNIKKFPRLEKTKNQRGQTFFTESDRNRTLQFVQGSNISGSQICQMELKRRLSQQMFLPVVAAEDTFYNSMSRDVHLKPLLI